MDETWSALTQGLAAQLERMTDDADHLVIELPDGGGEGATPYVQFAGTGEGMFRAELAGDAYLSAPYRLDASAIEALQLMGWRGNDADEPNWFVEQPLSQAATVAAMVTGAMRETYGVAHPQLMTYRAWGPAAEGASGLGLSRSAELEIVEPSEPMVLTPTNSAQLREMVEMAMHVKYDAAPVVDSDGDIVLNHLGQLVWVRVLPEQPAIEIFARVAHDVHSRRSTAIEVGILNRTHAFVKWTMKERAVWQHIITPALPFVPGLLSSMVDVFLGTMEGTRDDLVLRAGGKVA